jgi:hypothetical protein
MYRVWAIIPTANWIRGSAMLQRWWDKGYRTCAVIDKGTERPSFAHRIVELDPYPGHPNAINAAWKILEPSSPDIVICGSDDIGPPEGFIAEQLAEQFHDRFGVSRFGIMFPTGDDMPEAKRGCTAQWFGSGWCKRAFNGSGPLWGGYRHFYNDSDVWEVAHRLGVAWDRSDLIQRHDHWSRQGTEKPLHMHKWAATWADDEREFKRREAQGFPAFLKD